MNTNKNNMDKQHILVIGDGGVGKTSYIRNQIGKKFRRQYFPTERLNIYETNTTVWYDFPGQQKYGSHYILDKIDKIDTVIYMYDLTNNLSFKNLNYWQNFVHKCFGNICSHRIGSKSDLNPVITNSDIKNTNIHN